MTSDANVKALLSQAEADLTQVIRALASAEPGALAASERQLFSLVETLSEIERSVRVTPTLPVREFLLTIRTMLGQSRKLSSFALGAIARQMDSRNLFPAGPASILCVEG